MSPSFVERQKGMTAVFQSAAVRNFHAQFGRFVRFKHGKIVIASSKAFPEE